LLVAVAVVVVVVVMPRQQQWVTQWAVTQRFSVWQWLCLKWSPRPLLRLPPPLLLLLLLLGAARSLRPWGAMTC
jgi:hypothetical protein